MNNPYYLINIEKGELGENLVWNIDELDSNWINKLLKDCYSLEEWNLWDNFIYEPEYKSMVWC